VSLIPDKPAAVAASAPSTGVSKMSTNPASTGASVRQIMEQHTSMMGEIQAAQLRILESTLAPQRETVAGAAVGKIVQQIAVQTDEFLSALGRAVRSFSKMSKRLTRPNHLMGNVLLLSR
jgi:hypothetical protein